MAHAQSTEFSQLVDHLVDIHLSERFGVSYSCFCIHVRDPDMTHVAHETEQIP